MLILRSLFLKIPNLGGIFQKIMLTAFNEVYALSQEKTVTLRMAAYMVAIKRITTAGKLRGGPISMG
ncbi:MAG: hypothetical protein ACLRIP_14370 [Blautia massiliensis (ex Durand et al. 2017)]